MEWKHGQKAALARATGLSPSFITELTARRRRASAALSIVLEEACERLDIDLDRHDWSNPQWSSSPLFEGHPQK